MHIHSPLHSQSQNRATRHASTAEHRCTSLCSCRAWRFYTGNLSASKFNLVRHVQLGMLPLATARVGTMMQHADDPTQIRGHRSHSTAPTRVLVSVLTFQ